MIMILIYYFEFIKLIYINKYYFFLYIIPQIVAILKGFLW